eukprot:TRINITY_DN2872_c0_g1_i1.p1 TRINITY_DN2872_c0_g1~~TRINITY_DN2872_c0_g1_i1.p1  ORF type:complete len:539 (-),score=39.89 TRINITY_DN2872_c0_g1_i1:44-1660(-)
MAKLKDQIPRRKLIPVLILLYCESFNSTSIFTYVQYLVFDLKQDLTLEEVGNYAGLVASCWFLAQFLSSYVWGRASDKFGRRPILLLGVTGSLISCLVFGFSISLPMAIVSRSLNGLLNGNIGIVKTYVAEITTSATQAKAFSYVGLMWGIGAISGSFIGGITARPAENYPKYFSKDGFFGKFPYAAPNLISASVTLAGLVSCYLFLTENVVQEVDDIQLTNIKPAEDLDNNPSVNENIPRESENYLEGNADNSSSTDTLLQESSQAVNEQSEEHRSSFSLSGLKRKFKTIVDVKITQFPKTVNRDVGIYSCSFLSADVFRVCLMYTILGFAYTLFDEMLPLWIILPPDKGGLLFSTSQLGIVNAMTGIGVILVQLFVFSRVATLIGLIQTFRIGAVLSIPMFLFFPWTYRLNDYPVLLWIVLGYLSLLRALAAQLSFSSVMALIVNSVNFKDMGAVNGLGQSMVSFLRSIGPFLGGLSFAWSVKTDTYFPFNHHFMFVVVSLLMVLLMCLTIRMPLSLNKPKLESESQQRLISVQAD